MAIRKAKQTDPKKTNSSSATSNTKPTYQTPPDIRSKYDQMRSENTQKALQKSRETSSSAPKKQLMKKTVKVSGSTPKKQLMMKTTKVK
jgi:hypothetical protein